MKLRVFILSIFLFGFTVNHYKTTNVGLTLIKSYEHFEPAAYNLHDGKWTYGYGETKGVHQGMRITEPEAVILLSKSIVGYENEVNRVIYRSLKWHEFDALSSFTYNVGSLNEVMQNMVNKNMVAGVCAEMKRHNIAHINGVPRVMNGLTRRRNSEIKLYQTGQLCLQ